MRSVKKRIAIFGLKGLPSFGGAARANENIISKLQSKYDFTVYSVSTHADKEGYHDGYYQIIFKGSRFKRLNIFFYYIKSVLHSLLCDNYDLVMINHTSSGFIAPLLRLKYKIVARATGIIPNDDNKWNKFDKTFFHISSILFFYFSNECITVSKPHIKLYEKISNKSIHYIPNGIDIREQFIRSKNPNLPMLFAAGRIISLKGGHVLLEALKKLELKIKLKFIGDLNQNNKYKHHILDLSQGLDVDFVSLIKDKNILFEHIRLSSLFVFPSFNEGMSNMLLEVVSLSVPVICSNIAENKSIFDSDEVLFFDTGDADDLSKKIHWAYNNYALMLEKAEMAYKKLETEYKLEIVAGKYSRIYDSLVKAKKV